MIPSRKKPGPAPHGSVAKKMVTHRLAVEAIAALKMKSEIEGLPQAQVLEKAIIQYRVKIQK